MNDKLKENLRSKSDYMLNKDFKVLGHLQVFCQKLEDYNIKKRNEALLEYSEIGPT